MLAMDAHCVVVSDRWALTWDGQVVLSACRQGDQRQPLCDELGGYPEMRVRAWEATRRMQLS